MSRPLRADIVAFALLDIEGHFRLEQKADRHADARREALQADFDAIVEAQAVTVAAGALSLCPRAEDLGRVDEEPVQAFAGLLKHRERVDPDLVLLVADAGLGTINAVLLSIAPFSSAAPSTRIITVLNRFSADDDLHVRNLEWLRTREGLEVVTDPEALASLLSS